jgi:hypothetical protein
VVKGTVASGNEGKSHCLRITVKSEHQESCCLAETLGSSYCLLAVGICCQVRFESELLWECEKEEQAELRKS